MKPVTFLVLAPVALSLGVAHALSYRGGAALPASPAFSIDGRRFVAEDPGGDIIQRAQRELERRGIDPRPVTDRLASVLGSETIDPLREEPAGRSPDPLPRGLEPDRALRLETATGPVEIAFGRVACTERDLLARLRSAGWDCRNTDASGGPGAIAQLTKGKETSFVIVGKHEGRFLSIRRTSR